MLPLMQLPLAGFPALQIGSRSVPRGFSAWPHHLNLRLTVAIIIMISKELTHQVSESIAESEPTHDQHSAPPVNKTTPLTFLLPCNNSYLFSYHKQQLLPSIVKGAIWLLLNLLLSYMIRTYFPTLSPTITLTIQAGLILQIVLYFLICFVDAGTLFQDEDEDGRDERQRIFCMVCKLYRRTSSKHCGYCNRCVRSYDHHCGVFQKCIGGKNVLIFWSFIGILIVEIPCMIILFAYQAAFDKP